jgi:NAD(P)-dependent dehydrogenase (short-subunit alcohol dehydrogenase family)
MEHEVRLGKLKRNRARRHARDPHRRCRRARGRGACVEICGRSHASVENAVTQPSNGLKNKLVGKLAVVRGSTEAVSFFQFVADERRGLDILVNNAGIGVFESAAELSMDNGPSWK